MERHRQDFGYGKEGYVFSQKTFEDDGPNPLLSFGPIEVSLQSLFKQGMFLFAEGCITKLSSPRHIRIYLVKTKEGAPERQMFRVGHAHFSSLMEKSLQHFVKKNVPASSGRMIFPWWYDDPAEALARIYPKRKPKEAPMMGNQTLKEFVASP